MKYAFRWFILYNCTADLANLCKTQRIIDLLCSVLKVVSNSFQTFSRPHYVL